MPKTLMDVTKTAQEFLGTSGYMFSYLDNIRTDQDIQQWILTFNVGVPTPMLKKVVVDDATGQGVAFE
jgi:hypothetical protein